MSSSTNKLLKLFLSRKEEKIQIQYLLYQHADPKNPKANPKADRLKKQRIIAIMLRVKS